MIQLGCLLTSLGVLALLISLFGLQHMIGDFARLASGMPFGIHNLAGSISGLTEVSNAILLIVFGLFFLFLGSRVER